jgi:hypothetical protein
MISSPCFPPRAFCRHAGYLFQFFHVSGPDYTDYSVTFTTVYSQATFGYKLIVNVISRVLFLAYKVALPRPGASCALRVWVGSRWGGTSARRIAGPWPMEASCAWGHRCGGVLVTAVYHQSHRRLLLLFLPPPSLFLPPFFLLLLLPLTG